MHRLIKNVCQLGLLLLCIALGAYLFALSGLKNLDNEARVSLGGEYLTTPAGVISYNRQGPADGPVVILVHGFSTPKFVWDQITPSLAEAGYHVVSFDHLGRGFSDRPEGPYDANLYQNELSSLISGLELQTPLTLVGYSMGGANVVDFTASNLTLVKQLLLIAPAGYMPSSDTILSKPLIGEWITTVFGKYYALSGIRKEIEAGLAPADMATKFEQQAQYRGYTNALLSTLRHYPMADMAHRYRIIGEADIPVTAIWGTDDQIVPYNGTKRMKQDVNQLELVSLDGGNHNITYARAKEVSAALLNTLDLQPD